MLDQEATLQSFDGLVVEDPTRCISLKFVVEQAAVGADGTLDDAWGVIPLAWVVQAVQALPDPSCDDPQSPHCRWYVNKYYWGSYM